MLRLFIKLLAAVFIAVLAPGIASVAWAGPGGKADPTDDVFDGATQKTGPGHLDLVKVSHDDDGERVTYTVRTAHEYATTDLDKVFLNIEELPGLPQYDCQQVTAFVVQKRGELEGRLSQCLGSGGGQEGGPGGSKTLGIVDATHEESTDTLTFSFDLEPLRDAGFKGISYNYSVVIEEAGTEKSDKVPNDHGYNSTWITHTLSAPPTP